MAINENAKMVAVPLQEVDKNVYFGSGYLTIPAGAAGSEGIIRIQHNMGQALLPEGMFYGRKLGSNIQMPPNYQDSDICVNLACSSTDIIFSYYKLSTWSGELSYWVRLIAL